MFQKNKMIVLILTILSLTSKIALGNQECTQLPDRWFRAEVQKPNAAHGGLIHLKAYGIYMALDLFCGWNERCTGFLNGQSVEGSMKNTNSSKGTVEITLQTFSPHIPWHDLAPFICSTKGFYE